MRASRSLCHLPGAAVLQGSEAEQPRVTVLWIVVAQPVCALKVLLLMFVVSSRWLISE